MDDLQENNIRTEEQKVKASFDNVNCNKSYIWS